jgi:hypothetical protein
MSLITDGLPMFVRKGIIPAVTRMGVFFTFYDIPFDHKCPIDNRPRGLVQFCAQNRKVQLPYLCGLRSPVLMVQNLI